MTILKGSGRKALNIGNIMSKNQGKIFESQYKRSCEKQNILCVRFNDTSTSYIKEKNARFTPSNICDFFTFFKRNAFFIEC